MASAPDLVEFLLREGNASIDLQVNDLSSFHYAALRGSPAVMDVLVNVWNEGFSAPDAESAVVPVAVKDEVSAPQLLVNRVGRLKAPLHFAICRGHYEVAELLISKVLGIDLQVADREGNLALHHAAAVGCIPLVKLLLEKTGTRDIPRQNKEGCSPLDLARYAWKATKDDATSGPEIVKLFNQTLERERLEAEERRKAAERAKSFMVAHEDHAVMAKAPDAKVQTFYDTPNELGVGTSPTRNTLGVQAQTMTSRREKIVLDCFGVTSLSDEQLQEIFKLFDPNEDGQISKSEFKPAFKEMFENYGAPMSDKDVDRLFDKFDIKKKGRKPGGGNSGDGFLSFTEFSLLVMNRMKQ